MSSLYKKLKFDLTCEQFADVVEAILLPGWLPVCLPVWLPTGRPASQPGCLPARLPDCLPPRIDFPRSIIGEKRDPDRFAHLFSPVFSPKAKLGGGKGLLSGEREAFQSELFFTFIKLDLFRVAGKKAIVGTHLVASCTASVYLPNGQEGDLHAPLLLLRPASSRSVLSYALPEVTIKLATLTLFVSLLLFPPSP